MIEITNIEWLGNDSSYAALNVKTRSNILQEHKTYFRRFSRGSLISFCILTLIISPGVPMKPPQPPDTAARKIF
uniref:Uncharacterized protein n=1 Tax=Romanomermis culicivorax TaxID=13658 RepID=A0A915K0X5_ROMCU